MKEEFFFNIGGCPILFQFPHHGQFPKRLTPFQKVRRRERPLCTIRTSYDLPPPRENSFRVSGASPNSPVRALLLNERLTRGTLYLRRKPKDLSSFYWPTLYLIVYHVLTKQKGFFIHASSLMDRGKGFLFVGPSGAGKTTMARLFHHNNKESVVLNDDRTIVRKMKSTFRLFGSPWRSSGLMASADSIPLSAIFFLSHGHKNRLLRLTPKEAVQRFLPQAFLPPWNLEGCARSLPLALEVCEKIPSYALAFIPHHDTVPFLRGFFKKHD